MYRVEKQVTDDGGIHRWSRVVTVATREDAEKAKRAAALASLTAPHAEGYRNTAFRLVPVLAAVACMVLQ